LIIPERHHEKTLIILQRLERFVTTWAFATLLAMLTLVAIVGILHEELYRNRFLPTLTDADLDRLARNALREKQSVRK
jgi:hypothetical protein